jgi:hypothetical protein
MYFSVITNMAWRGPKKVTDTVGRTPDFATEASDSQNAQGIEAEIPQTRHRRVEELERIARSPLCGDAPNINPAFGPVEFLAPAQISTRAGERVLQKQAARRGGQIK